MQFFEATTKFVLRKSSSNSKKEKPCSIYASVELSWKREPIYLSTGKKILPSLFSKSGKPIISDFEEGTKPFQELLNINLNLEVVKIKEGDKISRCILSEQEIEIVFNEWVKIPPTRGKINTFKSSFLNSFRKKKLKMKRFCR